MLLPAALNYKTEKLAEKLVRKLVGKLLWFFFYSQCPQATPTYGLGQLVQARLPADVMCMLGVAFSRKQTAKMEQKFCVFT